MQLPDPLSVVSYVSHDNDPAEGTFPSWVPKWFQPRLTEPLLGSFHAGFIRTLPDYNSSIATHLIRDATHELNSLKLDGFYIDRVQNVSNVMIVKRGERLETGNIWRQLFPNCPYCFPSELQYRNRESLDMAFFRTLMADTECARFCLMRKDLQSVPRNPSDLTAYYDSTVKLTVQAFIKELSNAKDNISAQTKTTTSLTQNQHSKKDPHVELVRDWEAGAQNASNNRRVYLTQNGYIGLGPKMMREGDEICVLYGGRSPFILRRRGDHYLMVGETYLHDKDIMTGGLAKAVHERRSSIRCQTYVLR